MYVMYVWYLCMVCMYSNSECMALINFFRGGCAIYLVLKKSFPICTRNSKCARRWRNPTCAKWAKLRHLPHFLFFFPSSGTGHFGHQNVEKKGCVCVCSTKAFRGKDFSLLNRWRNHLGQCHPIAGGERRFHTERWLKSNTQAYLSFTAM